MLIPDFMLAAWYTHMLPHFATNGIYVESFQLQSLWCILYSILSVKALAVTHNMRPLQNRLKGWMLPYPAQLLVKRT